MATIRHHARIDAPADTVWALVTDAGGIAGWMPGLDESSLEGDMRTVKMGPMEVKERIVTNDADLRRLQYTIVEPPVGQHLATIDVIDQGDGCLLVYGCDLDDPMYDMLNPMYEGATQAIKTHIES
jgi:uncharacterized protein YndB with AHSA1/START domain